METLNAKYESKQYLSKKLNKLQLNAFLKEKIFIQKK